MIKSDFLKQMAKMAKKIHMDKILLILILTYNPIYASGITQYTELYKILNFVSFIIELIRFTASGIAGLIATLAGWQVLMNKNGQGLETAKKIFTNSLIAFAIIFSGSSLAKFMVDKMASFLL